MKRIVSVWLPSLAVDRLARAEPWAVPDDRPLALTESGPRGLAITAVNGAGWRQGIRPGLTLADARAAWPGLVTRPAERTRDASALLDLARWAGRYGPARNCDGEDGLWVDVTGVAHLFGGPDPLGGEESLLANLVGRLGKLGFRARAGLADTLGAAHALARHAAPGGRQTAIAPPGEARATLADFPVAALRLESQAVVLLRRLGLARIGQLYDLPRDALARRFRYPAAAGRGGGRHAEVRSHPRPRDVALAGAVLTRLDQALGVTHEPRRPLGEPPQRLVGRHFPEPLTSSDGLMAAVRALAAELALRLGHEGVGARRFRLALYRSDGSVGEAVIGASVPSRDAAHILRLLEVKLAALDAGFGIDVVTLGAAGVEPVAARQTVLAPDGEHRRGEGSAALVDRLVNRLGEARVHCLEAAASHIPERAERRLPALAGRQRHTPASSPAAACPPGPRPPRPPFLLSPPERMEVVAEVPEGPPARFTWRRLQHRVAKAEGPERIAPEWWRELARETPSRPRDYYRLEDDRGGRYWVFRDGLYQREAEDGPPQWFVHGLFG